MIRMIIRQLIPFLLVAATAAGGEEALDIAKRSLPFVKEKGLAWIEERQCASCHQIPSMLWSLNTAARAGIEAESKETAEWTPWAADWRHWNKTGDKEGVDKVSSGNIDTMAFLLLGRDVSAVPPPEWTGQFRAQILKNQQPDGSWKAGGQLPLGKRPPREIAEVTTMWALLALQSFAGEPVPAEAANRAEDFLAQAQPGQSAEWHAVRLLLNPGDPGRCESLLKAQHEDGSWGWLVKEPGDALGTGLALYALAKSRLPAARDARQRAVAYLKSAQTPEGSWPVPSTRARDQNKISKTATYWGSAWAVIGLLEESMKWKMEAAAIRGPFLDLPAINKQMNRVRWANVPYSLAESAAGEYPVTP